MRGRTNQYESLLVLSKKLCNVQRLPVVGAALCLVAIPTVLSIQFFYSWAYYKDELTSYTVLGIFNLTALMSLINFALTYMSNPGFVPSNYSSIEQSAGKCNNRLLYWCNICKRERPVRAHHCRTCGKCVAVFDHHCPWVDNCIGYNNAGHFLRLLILASSSILQSIILISWRICDIFRYERQFRGGIMTKGDLFIAAYPNTIEVTVIVVMSFLIFALAIMVGSMTCAQLFMCTKNKTTIDKLEEDKIKDLVLEKKIPIDKAQFPFDLGIWKNLRSYLGSPLIFWFIPRKRSGSGLSHIVSRPLEKDEIWPPLAYHQYKAVNMEGNSSLKRASIKSKKVHKHKNSNSVKPFKIVDGDETKYKVQEMDERARSSFTDLCVNAYKNFPGDNPPSFTDTDELDTPDTERLNSERECKPSDSTEIFEYTYKDFSSDPSLHLGSEKSGIKSSLSIDEDKPLNVLASELKKKS